jgi:hypothetical protein
MSGTKTTGRAKVAAIPVLGLVLVAVVYGNFFRGPSQLPPPPRAPRGGVETATNLPSPAASASKPLNAHWPVIELESVVAHDPFLPLGYTPPTLNSVGRASADAAAKETASTAAVARPPHLQAVYQHEGVTVAIVDARVVHVGDVLPGKGRVVELSSSGIKLAEE